MYVAPRTAPFPPVVTKDQPANVWPARVKVPWPGNVIAPPGVVCAIVSLFPPMTQQGSY